MNIKDIHNCYGCGLCATACNRKIIEIRLNPDGFYEPHITDDASCTNCGVCTDVCAYLHDDLSLTSPQISGYAAWSKEPAVRRKCSSGGIGFELGRYLIGEGYKVCGVKYNVDNQRAEHYIATTVEELIPSIGSKYIQSYTVDGFKAINKKEKYLVTGTPCQIDSFRRYVQKFRVEDNFVLMDFFCHGVPSMWVWKKYLQMVEKTTGKATYVSWRNKFTGWHDSWAMSIDGERTGEKVNWHNSYNLLIKEKKGTYNSRLSQGDVFYKLFLGDYCCNPACQKECKYKYRASSADIRIGDLWGKTYKDNEDGVSAAVAFTPKGNEILKSLNCTLVEHPFDTVAEGQMKKNCGKAYLTTVAMKLLHFSHEVNANVWRSLFIVEKLLRLPKRIFNKIKRTISK
ncbi:Coenzyme F420 hydrogenase/dehydrogenase, beta subunit C-terminal domain [Phocaeicola sp.]